MMARVNETERGTPEPGVPDLRRSRRPVVDEDEHLRIWTQHLDPARRGSPPDEFDDVIVDSLWKRGGLERLTSGEE